MKTSTEHQFATLEDAHNFVVLLAETAEEAKREIESDVQRESASSRRLDALRIALYNLEKLGFHVNRASRILNDLRTLRRLLCEERNAAGQTEHAIGGSRLPSGSAADQHETATTMQSLAACLPLAETQSIRGVHAPSGTDQGRR
jgi:hypothetical protein